VLHLRLHGDEFPSVVFCLSIQHECMAGDSEYTTLTFHFSYLAARLVKHFTAYSSLYNTVAFAGR
jgi:hypothetical protein